MGAAIAFLLAASALASDVFEARSGGYLTYRIPGIVVTPRGEIIAYAEARKDGIGDWADIDILMRRSIDGGRTWEHARVLADAGTGTANNPVAILDRKGGMLHFLYCVNYARAFYMRSRDQGNTFTEPVDITSVFEEFRSEYNWNVIATGPGHGIQLRKGRLVVPVWLSTGGKKHRPSVVSTIYSDDHGKTWHRGEIISGILKNPSETVAVELSNGRVMLNIRNESPEHRRAVVTGPDGAHNWTAPVFDDALREPICMGSIARVQDKRGPIVFVNPDSDGRRNLTAKMSWDEGKSWQESRVLDAGISAYSDTFVAPDKTVYVLYERDGVDGKATEPRFLTLLKFQAPETAK
jgi:sialidase-1